MTTTSVASPNPLQQDLQNRMRNDATELASAVCVQAVPRTLTLEEQPLPMDEKHLTRITPKLKTRYKLHPSGQPENTSAGVNMALLAYAGPYKAIGQSIREPLQSAQTALKMTADIAAEQVRVQRAAAALAQRKANARAAAEEAHQSGQGLKGPKHRQGPSSSFVSMSRAQRQRPASGTASSSSSLGPGWYHVRHTAVEKQPHAAHLQPNARPASAPGKAAARMKHPALPRRQSSKAGAKTTEEGQTDEPPLLVLPRKGSLSAQPGTPGRSLLGTSPNADSAPANSGLACTNTNMTSDMMQQTLGRTATGLGPDFLRQTLTRTNTDMGQDFMRQTLGRTNTNMGPDMLRQTLGRTNANMGSGFFGRTLGRTGTGMGSVSFGNTKGRSIVEEFGMTQPAVPPLCIDPLVAALMQKAGTDVPLSQPRSTSPAFVSPGRTPRQADVGPRRAGAASPVAMAPIADDSAVRRRCQSPMAFQLQTRRGQGSSEGQGKAHLAPGMHFRDLDTPDEHLRAGHPPSLQNLDFARQTPRPPLASDPEEGGAQGAGQQASVVSQPHGQQLPARPQSSARPRRLKRPLSAWAEGPSGGAPCLARPRAASALPFACSPASTAGQAADNGAGTPHLFWTPPKQWMLACMEKTRPPRNKAASVSGAEHASWEQWASEQTDIQSLDSFCVSAQSARPDLLQSPYSPGRRGGTPTRPSSAAPCPQACPRTPQLWSRLTNSPQDGRHHKVSGTSAHPVQTPRSTTASAGAETPSMNSTDEERDGVSSSAAVQKQAVSKRSKSALCSRPRTAAARRAESQALPMHEGDSSETGQAHASDPPVAGQGPAGRRARPFSAQPQAKPPGTFLRNARPQSAAAANIAGHARPKSPSVGASNFNEPKRESGWVDFRAQNRMGTRVHGGAISAVTRMEALHSMRPLTQTQGPFELTGPSPLAPYMTVKYNPHDEVRSHRRRSPSWTLPPNRSIPKWKGTVHRSGLAQGQQARNRNGWQQEWQKWVQVAASNLHQRPA